MLKSSQKLCQGDPVKHCPFHHCISGQVSSFHHIEFESLSIIFIILFSSSCFKCLALWSSAPINKSAPIIQSITRRKAGNPYLANYFLYKWHQIYNFSRLPTYPLVNTRKRHMTIFLVDIPVKLQSGQAIFMIIHEPILWQLLFPLLNHMQKVMCRRFGREIVCPNMRV